MPAGVIAAEVEHFRAWIADRLGIHFDDAKLGFVADVLRRRVESNGSAPGVYLETLAGLRPPPEELRALARELTVTETYFFRNIEQFRALTEVALPERMRARAARRTLRLLSAGCASGEEAYTLAILVREHLPEAAGWDISIRGIDINTSMLEKARRASYTAWSLRETPATVQRRWFRDHGREFELDGSVRAMVTFEEHNLIEEDPALWQREAFDVIFCRNVLMYFIPEKARAVVARLTRALASDGFLFLGHAETLRGLSQDFHLQHTHGTFYYRRRERMERDAPGVGVPLVAFVEAADSWVDTVRRAAERIEVVTESPAPAVAPGPRGSEAVLAVSRGWDLAGAVELLREERFQDALAFVRALPAESERDADVLLLRAVLLTHSGELAAAEEVCTDLLTLDEMNAGAHYLLALCREGRGDRQGAIDHDQVAAYLDPGFAMPKLHLGLLARKARDREAARHELGQAHVLLQREDASRVLLFGGGFSRETLVALCHAELVASGGKP